MLSPQVPRKAFGGRSVGRKPREAFEGLAGTAVSIRRIGPSGTKVLPYRLFLPKPVVSPTGHQSVEVAGLKSISWTLLAR
jgi:hypothetical protein